MTDAEKRERRDEGIRWAMGVMPTTFWTSTKIRWVPVKSTKPPPPG